MGTSSSMGIRCRTRNSGPPVRSSNCSRITAIATPMTAARLSRSVSVAESDAPTPKTTSPPALMSRNRPASKRLWSGIGDHSALRAPQTDNRASSAAKGAKLRTATRQRRPSLASSAAARSASKGATASGVSTATGGATMAASTRIVPGVAIARAERRTSTVGDGTDFEEIAAAEIVERLLVEIELAALLAYAGLGEHQELCDIDPAVMLEIGLAVEALERMCGEEAVRRRGGGIAVAVGVEGEAARPGENEAADLVADAVGDGLVARLLLDRIACRERRRIAGIEHEEQIALDLRQQREELRLTDTVETEELVDDLGLAMGVGPLGLREALRVARREVDRRKEILAVDGLAVARQEDDNDVLRPGLGGDLLQRPGDVGRCRLVVEQCCDFRRVVDGWGRLAQQLGDRARVVGGVGEAKFRLPVFAAADRHHAQPPACPPPGTFPNGRAGRTVGRADPTPLPRPT